MVDEMETTLYRYNKRYVCIYIYIYIYTPMCMFMYIHVHMYEYVYMYVFYQDDIHNVCIEVYLAGNQRHLLPCWQKKQTHY